MSLPLLSSSYFEQPTTAGLVSSKTADLIAAEGDAMAKRIEAQSYSIDAKNLAKPITDLYSSAYQKIAGGDFTGFADMQKARSLAIGNPILMKTMDDADLIAGHLANTVISGNKTEETQAFQMRKQDAMNTAIADRQSALQDRIDTRADTRETRQNRIADDRQADFLYKTQYSDWEKEKYQEDKQYEAAQTLYKKQMAAWETQVQNGIDAPKPTEPTPPKTRPAPKLSDFKNAAPLPSQQVDESLDLNTTNPPPRAKGSKPSGGVIDTNLDLPSADGVTGAGATGLIPQDVPSTPKPDFRTTPPQVRLPEFTSVPSPDPMPPAAAPEPTHLPPDAKKPIVEQFANRVAENKPVANLVFGYDPDTQSGALVTLHRAPSDVTEAVTDTSTGKNEIKIKPSKEMENARDALSVLDNIHGGQFGQWFAMQIRLGNKVSIDPVPGLAKDKNLTFAARSAGQTFSDPKTGQTIPMSKDAHDALEQVVKSVGDGVLRIQFPDIPDKHKEEMKNKIIAAAASDPTSFNYDRANNYLKAHGITEIKPEDVKAKSDSIKQAALGEAQKIHDKHLAENVDSDLRSMGFILPSQATDDTSSQLVNSSKRLREIPKEIDSLNQTIASIKAKTNKPEGEDLTTIRNALTQIKKLQLDEQEHRKILIFKNPTPMSFSQ